MTIAPAHQLPPVVHAIGASVGSAIATFIFYPLERARLKIQSRGEGESDRYNREGSDGNQNTPQKRNDPSRVEHTAENSASTPNSPAGTFELVSDVDVVSLGTMSFDDDPADPNVRGCIHADDDDDEEGGEKEEIASGGSLREAATLILDKSATSPLDSVFSGCESVRLGADVNQDRDSKPLCSQSELDNRKPPPPETIRSLYKGASHLVTTIMISNGVFFYALQVVRRSLASIQKNRRQQIGRNDRPQRSFLPSSKMGNSLLASSLAGAINVLLTNPLWVASLRIMESKAPIGDGRLQKQLNLWNVMHHIACNEGIFHLWNGTRTSLLLVSNPIIQHFLYEQLRLWLLGRRSKRAGLRGNISRGKHRHGRKGNNPSLTVATLSPLEAFLFGAMAKAVATLVTYPLQLTQVLLRLQKKNLQTDIRPGCQETHDGSRAYEGTLDCLCQQFSRGGVPALFKGMNAKLLQTVLTSAFTFLTYEQTLVQAGRIYETFGSKR